MWIFIVEFKDNFYCDKRLYILIKHENYYKSLGFHIQREERKLISYNTLTKKYLNLNYLCHISQQPEETVINKRNKIEFMYANKILMPGFEKVMYSKKVHLNRTRKKYLNNKIAYLINEFTKDARY